MSGQESEFRRLSPGMSRMLYVACALVFGVGVPLLVLTEYTDKLFAWTVFPPLTAAFLGACYWSAGVLQFTAARERSWARARVAVPGVLLFTILTCIPTALNIDHFNLRSPAAYAWIAVYFGVPPILGLLWWRQTSAPGIDEPRSAPLAVPMRLALAGLGVWLLALGTLMSLAPDTMTGCWPWELNPPESPYANLARMEPYLGIWLIGLGTVAAHAAFESDLRRLRCVFAAAIALPLLSSIAVGRYPGTVLWSRPATWAFLATLTVLLVIGAAGVRALRRLNAPDEKAANP